MEDSSGTAASTDEDVDAITSSAAPRGGATLVHVATAVLVASCVTFFVAPQLPTALARLLAFVVPLIATVLLVVGTRRQLTRAAGLLPVTTCQVVAGGFFGLGSLLLELGGDANIGAGLVFLGGQLVLVVVAVVSSVVVATSRPT